MKLKDALDNYYYYSGKTSDLIRQLGLAGIAVVWLFRQVENGIPRIPAELSMPLVLIIVGLACDLLHYAVASSIWGIYHRCKEKTVNKDTEFEAPSQINWPALFFFMVKVTLIVVAYAYLLHYLFLTIL